MIRFENVSFSYGRRQVLKDLNLEIREDERVAVLGGSGEGKTTILKLILGLIRPDRGKIFLGGREITEMPEDGLREVRKIFSIVFQEGALFDSLDVKENVAFCLREFTDMSEEEIDRKVRELLRVVDVEQAIGLMPEELSGGMHRRVAIARALAASEPRMMLYDEPTSGLDPVNADNICQLILDLSGGGKGFIVVTHKVIDAVKIADRFIFIRDGRILFDGGRDGLLDTEIEEIRTFMRELRFAVTCGILKGSPSGYNYKEVE